MGTQTEPFREAARAKGMWAKKSLMLVHRLDGPYYCSRFGKDPRVDAKRVRNKQGTIFDPEPYGSLLAIANPAHFRV